MVGNANDGVDAKRQRGGDQHGPGNVGSLTQSKATFGLEHANRQQGSGYANRKVDEEDPVPVTDDRVIGCAFSFARSRVRAFNGSMFWLGQRAARARLDGGERRGHMQPNTPRRKNARTRERANENAQAAG